MASNGNTNLPILVYSSALLLVLRRIARDEAVPVASKPLLSDAWWLPVLVAACWIPLLATLWTVLDDALHSLRRRRWTQIAAFDADADADAADAASNVNDYGAPRWALVTGASQGIGRAIVIELVRDRGISVVAVARNQLALEELRSELGGSNSNSNDNDNTRRGLVLPIRCDVSDRSDVDRLLETLATTEVPRVEHNEQKQQQKQKQEQKQKQQDRRPKLLDHIDILVNNAGAGDSSDFFRDGCSNERLHDLMALNVVGTTHLTQTLGRAMRRRTTPGDRPRLKRIAVVSSVMGVFPGNAGCAVYAATKAYQRSWCASLSRELELEQQPTQEQRQEQKQEQTNPETVNSSSSSSSSSSSGKHPLSVTCVLPGAVGATGFEASSHMQDAPVFWLPGLALTPEHVATATVGACLRPAPPREVVVGIVYQLTIFGIVDWLPRRVTQVLAELVTRPWKPPRAVRDALFGKRRHCKPKDD
eukprot:jgi/Psemu1/31787/gm1.31787_g